MPSRKFALERGGEKRVAIAWASAAGGALYARLGYLVKAKQSAVALAIAVGLFALDGIASIVMVWQATGRFSFGGNIMRVMLLIFMARGFTGIAKLRAR